MIIRFAAANYRSISERQELSLVTSALKDSEHGLIPCDAAPEGSLLPAAVIYGPNASGKSNFLAAARFLQTAVDHSHTMGRAAGGVPRTPFALAPAAAEQPTHVELDFIADGIRHLYGFECTDDEFTREWLFSFPNARRQLQYLRSGPREITFGRSLRGRNRVIADLMRPNSLFLSAATQNDHEQLSRISHYISRIAFLYSDYGSLADLHEVDKRTIAFLKNIGTGIVDVKVTKIDDSDDSRRFSRELSDLIKRFSSTDIDLQDDDRDRFRIELAHEGLDGNKIFLDISEESAGTKRVVYMFGKLLSCIDNGTPVFIDEIDSSLHTKIAELIIELFSDPRANKSGSQLIATTHDTNIMNCSALRRDQIWFCEKDRTGQTHLFPLSDIKTRKSDNLERGYLQGRYGAIPFSGQLSLDTEGT